MPTEAVINRDFESLFNAQVRYEIPFFQRGYAWERRQWKRMLEDVQEHILNELESGDDFKNLELFFGPVVVLEKANAPHPNLKRFLIIDGQQRITTVYLMLALIKKALDNKSHLSKEAQERSAVINNLIVNKIDSDDDYMKIKVFSSKGDRLPTYLQVFAENPRSKSLAADQQLYVAEQNQIDQFVKFFAKHIKNKDVPDLVNLSRAITESLKIVWIPLDEKKDDPQAIFESLNDAGMPLSAAELLCNYMFKPLINEATNEHEELHNDFWLKARKRVGSGEFENYLQNLFSIGEKKKVGQGRKMYVHFKARNRNMSKDFAKKVLQDILDYAPIYNSINAPIANPHEDAEIKKWLISIEQTNMRAVTPFLLALLMTLKQEGISSQETAGLLREVYVLLVRRKMADLRVTKYNSLFPNLLSRILNEPDKIKALQEEFRKEGMWVSDQDFKDAFIEKEIYRSRELNFTRHILQEIDKSMQNHGEFPDYSTISTIEHILPQTLDGHWKTYLGDEANHTDLKRISNSLGNLCLNSHSANSSFGQKSFVDKQEAYNDSSALARDVKKRKEPWNMEAIRARSKDLAEIGLKVWNWTIR